MKALLISIITFLAVVVSATAADYRIGIAQVVITPQTAMRIYDPDRLWRMGEPGAYPGDGLDLTLRAVYISRIDGSEPVVLVAADLVNFCPMDTDYARDPDNHGIPDLPRDRILINLTHTHCAPSSCDSSARVMPPQLKIDADPASEWRANRLRPKLVEVIQAAYNDALAHPEGANLWFHRNKANIAHNRRNENPADLTDSSGTAIANPEGYDRTLDVVEIYRDNGSRVGVLVFYGAHPVILPTGAFPDGKYYHHPDFVGFARKEIEDATPAGDIAIFFQAAGGDVNALPWNGGYDAARTVGEQFGQTVLDMMAETAQPPNVITQQVTPSQGGNTAFSRVWAAPLQTAAGDHRLGGTVGEPRLVPGPAAAGVGEPACPEGTHPDRCDWFRWADRWCEGFTGHGGGNPRCSPKPGVLIDRSWDVEMQTLSIGKWRVAGLSHEPVGLQGVKLRQRWPENWVSVAGYIGRTQNYLPVSAQLDSDDACACRYEGFTAQLWNGHPAAWATYGTTGNAYDLDAELQHVMKAETPQRVNYAEAWQGTTATASTELDANRPAAAAINGDRRGAHWGSDPATGSGWHDGTLNAYADWIELDLHAPRTIDEINVFSVQEDFMNPVEPTESMTTPYGLVDFKVEILTTVGWTTVKNGVVAANGKVWRKFTFAPITATKIKVTVTSGGAGHSRITEIEAWGNATSRPNVALASRGAGVQASSTLDPNRAAIAAINGDRKGVHWGSDPATGSGWHDQTQNSWGDTLEITFAASRAVNEINVFSVQDAVSNPVETTQTMTFASHGLIAFDVEYWTGSVWSIVPGGSITANDRVWRQIRFAPIVTSKIRIVVHDGAAGYSRVVEVEALTPYDYLSSVSP
jgi:hypothetical protein